MKKRIAVALLVVTLTVSPVFAQWFFGTIPVIDFANLANAADQLGQLEMQYGQLVSTYNQIVLQYREMLRMARHLPGIRQHRFSQAGWGASFSANTYGTTAGWTSALNSGIGVREGYGQAVGRLSTYASFGDIPADQVDRAKSEYASVELSDAANIHGMEVIGAERSKSGATDLEIKMLEDASLSEEDDFNTEIAVLNKINATDIMTLRSGQETNQILVALLERSIAESKYRRDSEAAAINANIAFRANARDAGLRGIEGTTDAITSFRMP